MGLIDYTFDPSKTLIETINEYLLAAHAIIQKDPESSYHSILSDRSMIVAALQATAKDFFFEQFAHEGYSVSFCKSDSTGPDIICLGLSEIYDTHPIGMNFDGPTMGFTAYPFAKLELVKVPEGEIYYGIAEPLPYVKFGSISIGLLVPYFHELYLQHFNPHMEAIERILAYLEPMPKESRRIFARSFRRLFKHDIASHDPKPEISFTNLLNDDWVSVLRNSVQGVRDELRP